jgi:hypothetical protein
MSKKFCRSLYRQSYRKDVRLLGRQSHFHAVWRLYEQSWGDVFWRLCKQSYVKSARRLYGQPYSRAVRLLMESLTGRIRGVYVKSVAKLVPVSMGSVTEKLFWVYMAFLVEWLQASIWTVHQNRCRRPILAILWVWTTKELDSGNNGSAVFICLPNVINTTYIRYLTKEILEPVQNTVVIYKHISILIFYCVSYMVIILFCCFEAR